MGSLQPAPFLKPMQHSCVTGLPKRGVVSTFLVGIQGCLKYRHRLAVLVKEAVADVSLVSCCPIPLSGNALLHVHTK